jgi:hypothetical protein
MDAFIFSLRMHLMNEADDSYKDRGGGTTINRGDNIIALAINRIVEYKITEDTCSPGDIGYGTVSRFSGSNCTPLLGYL